MFARIRDWPSLHASIFVGFDIFVEISVMFYWVERVKRNIVVINSFFSVEDEVLFGFD